MAAKMGRSIEQAQALRAKALDEIPLGRYTASPTRPPARLCSWPTKDSSFVPGIDLCVDGGNGQV